MIFKSTSSLLWPAAVAVTLSLAYPGAGCTPTESPTVGSVSPIPTLPDSADQVDTNVCVGVSPPPEAWGAESFPIRFPIEDDADGGGDGEITESQEAEATGDVEASPGDAGAGEAGSQPVDAQQSVEAHVACITRRAGEPFTVFDGREDAVQRRAHKNTGLICHRDPLEKC